MIELVFSACLIAAPANCKDVHLTYMADRVTPVQCMLYGQPHMAQWLQGNPRYRITRFRCVPAGQSGVTT